MQYATTIIKNAHIVTFDATLPIAWGVVIHSNRFTTLLTPDTDITPFAGSSTQVIDAGGRTIIPGLHDSHIHLIREGLNYLLEVRWDTVTSLKDALELLRQQVAITPPGQWVRVVGGWSEYQFAEKRMPTLEEINAISAEVPIFIMHLYERVLLNKAAIKALGKFTSSRFSDGIIEKDAHGNPTGLLLAHPGASILYSALAQAPHLTYEQQIDSTKQFLREMNRLGVTSVIDAGGGYQQYPKDYAVTKELADKQQLTVRITYFLFTQHPGHEFEDFKQWITSNKPAEPVNAPQIIPKNSATPDDGLIIGHHTQKITDTMPTTHTTSTTNQNTPDHINPFYRLGGAGEMLVYSAADYENFFQERPELPATMEKELEAIIRLLVGNRWPFRIHATYDKSISRMLTVFEKINQELPFDNLRWFFDHAETVSVHNLNRIKALGGGIAIQDRMAYQGEYFIERYGKEAARQAPPLRAIIDKEIPLSAGTDATRVASYNPWISLYWLVSGKTVGGTQLYDTDNKLNRLEALELWTVGSAWFSGEQLIKGHIAPGYYADLAILSDNYLTVPEEEIKNITSVLTMVGGDIVYVNDNFPLI